MKVAKLVSKPKSPWKLTPDQRLQRSWIGDKERADRLQLAKGLWPTCSRRLRRDNATKPAQLRKSSSADTKSPAAITAKYWLCGHCSQ